MTPDDNLRMIRQQLLENRSRRLAATLGGVPGADAARLAPVQKLATSIAQSLQLPVPDRHLRDGSGRA
jgi:hypothetical protein